MSHLQYTTKNRKGKHLNYKERIKIEALSKIGMKSEKITKQSRTKVYYAHPYSAWERGSNENANKLIRRFIPKGANIGEFSHERIKMIEHWINNYPRRIFGGMSSNMLKNHLNVA